MAAAEDAPLVLKEVTETRAYVRKMTRTTNMPMVPTYMAPYLITYPKKSDTRMTDKIEDDTYNPASLPLLLDRKEWGSDLLRRSKPD